MTRTRQVKTTFTAGEISEELLGRGDLRAYENGALRLRNLFINPTGGVTRRQGLQYVDTITGKGRLLAFEFNTQQTYLLVLMEKKLSIYLNDSKVTEVDAPWSHDQIHQVVWIQSADTLLLTHPDIPPQKLIRNATGAWSLAEWSYHSDEIKSYQPFYKFASSAVSLTPSGTTGEITLTSSSEVFSEDHENTQIRFRGIEATITDYESPTVVTVQLNEDLLDTESSIDWFEQAFSPAHGYPTSVAFHQDRLVIGGSRDLPNRLWFSKSGDLFNFDLGVGLDDEAIEFAILSDQVNAIRGIFSGRHLQIFTSGAEWMVSGSPLTPTTIQLTRQTRIGSVIDRYIPPVSVDGATLFVSRNKQEIREFLYTDLENAYQSTDLALLSKHIIKMPIDQDFDAKRRLLIIVREDGKFATLTAYRAEEVAAWTLHETEGDVLSVSVVGDESYVLVKRSDSYSIEKLSEGLHLDSALTGTAEEPTSYWLGLEHLNGKTVNAVGDGIVFRNLIVADGSINLPVDVKEIQVGIPYTHEVKPLPPNIISQIGQGRAIRMTKAIFRLFETSAMKVDMGNGLNDASLKDIGQSQILNAPTEIYSGDITMRAYGWRREGIEPLWHIQQDTPLPFSLLSVISEIKVST